MGGGTMVSPASRPPAIEWKQPKCITEQTAQHSAGSRGVRSAQTISTMPNPRCDALSHGREKWNAVSADKENAPGVKSSSARSSPCYSPALQDLLHEDYVGGFFGDISRPLAMTTADRSTPQPLHAPPNTPLNKSAVRTHRVMDTQELAAFIQAAHDRM